jgi:hypothetical protein
MPGADGGGLLGGVVLKIVLHGWETERVIFHEETQLVSRPDGDDRGAAAPSPRLTAGSGLLIISTSVRAGSRGVVRPRADGVLRTSRGVGGRREVNF